MSAFAAIVGRAGAPVSDAMLARMENALRLHGPDRQGRRVLDGAGLAAALMLGFTPEDRFERQPLQRADRWHLVLAGWISNRAEMLAALGIEAERAASMPDSALALCAWERWGEGAPGRLDGDFALALWDAKERRLVVARSILSAPPVYYHVGHERIALATAPKGIFALGDVTPELDELAIADSLVLNHEEVERSYFRDVRRLPLGSILTADADGVRVRRYYDPAAAPDVRFARDDDYVEAANELLDGAVADHLRARETPAISLSSGLDSSSVAVAAIDVLRRRGDPGAFPLVSYTSVPEGGWDGRAYGAGWVGDESGPVRALGALYPELELNFVDSAEQDVTAYLRELFLLGEIPPRNVGNIHWGVDIARAVRARGKRVLLNGFSGNGTISLDGRPRFPMLLKQGRLIELFRELRADAGTNSRLYTVFGKAVLPLLPHALYRRVIDRRGQSTAGGWRTWSAINPAFAASVDIEGRLRASGFDDYDRMPHSPRALATFLDFNGTRDEGQSVRAAIQALTGVQDRDPLGDRRLVEFCLGLPAEQFLHRGVNRRLVGRMMARRLPPEILRAPNGRQGADWHLRVTRRLDDYRDELARLAEDPEIAGRIDIPRLQRMMDTWPDQAPLSRQDHPDHLLAYLGLARALATARYIKWVKGSNA